jgi:quercetin dioxygenase-like cupin family protein
VFGLRIWLALLVAVGLLGVVAAGVSSQQGQGGGGGPPPQGPPTVESLNCGDAKQNATLGGEQSAVLASLGELTTLRSRADLGRLAGRGWSFRPNQFTSIEGIGVTVANPEPFLAPGAPNLLFYAPAGGAESATDLRAPDFPYELAGWGYEVPFAPFHFPGFLACVGEGEWHVHERGIDSLDSGRTTIMAPAENVIGGAGGSLADAPPMRPVVGYPHPRTWAVHFWRDPSGVPRSAILDPTSPAPGVDPGEGSNFYFLEEPPTAVLEPGATGLPVALAAGEGQLAKAGGGEYTLKSSGSNNRGASISVIEARLPSGSKRVAQGPTGQDEGWYILDGAMTFEADGQTLPARKGSFVYLPAGVDYSFEVTDGTARAVNAVASPGQNRRSSLKPYVLEPGEGEELTVGGGPYVLKATAADTGGSFSFMEINLNKGREPPPHIHHKEVETFYLLDGEVTFVTGGQVVPARTGGIVQLPIALPHYYSALGDGTVKALLIAVPAGLEDLFRQLDKLGSRPPTAAQALKTGVEPIIPPQPGGG